jgi:hypothetical protein
MQTTSEFVYVYVGPVAGGRLSGRANRPRRASWSLGAGEPSSADVLDDLNQLVESVAVATGEVDEFLRFLNDGAAFRCRCDRDAASATELEQSLVTQHPEGAEDGVRVDAEDGGQVLSGWEALSRLRLSFGDRPADLGGDLLVEIRGVAPVYLDIHNGASNTSSTVPGWSQR